MDQLCIGTARAISRMAYISWHSFLQTQLFMIETHRSLHGHSKKTSASCDHPTTCNNSNTRYHDEVQWINCAWGRPKNRRSSNLKNEHTSHGTLFTNTTVHDHVSPVTAWVRQTKQMHHVTIRRHSETQMQVIVMSSNGQLCMGTA